MCDRALEHSLGVAHRLACQSRHRAKAARGAARGDHQKVVSLELSRSTWLVTSLSPSGGEKMSKHSVPGGDISGLLMLFSRLTESARKRAGEEFPIIAIQEAGLDGFWIHPALEQEGIESHIVDAASIMTSFDAGGPRPTGLTAKHCFAL
jgi:transposase